MMKGLVFVLLAFCSIRAGVSQTISRSSIGSIQSSGVSRGMYVVSSNAVVSSQSSVAILSTPFVHITQEKSDPLLSVYPNPSNIYVYCSFSDKSTVSKVIIRNISGQLINTNFENQIDVSSLPSGIYLLEAFNSDGQSKTTKINVNQLK